MADRLPAVVGDQGAQQNFDALLKRLVSAETAATALAARTTALEARPAYSRGTGTVTVTNGTSGLSAAIAHGLGVTPTTVVATARRTADTRDDYFVDNVSRDATNIVVSIRGSAAEHAALGNPTTITFDWVAVA